MLKIIGYTLQALPFVVVAIIGIKLVGWKWVLVAFALVALLWFCVSGGEYLISLPNV